MSATVRSWRLDRRTGLTRSQLAREINPAVRGWIQYYAAFGLKEPYPLLQRISYYLVRWLRKKYRRLRTCKKLLPCRQRITSRKYSVFPWDGMLGPGRVDGRVRGLARDCSGFRCAGQPD
jgi:RNA-directed DNA polymerase